MELGEKKCRFTVGKDMKNNNVGVSGKAKNPTPSQLLEMVFLKNYCLLLVFGIFVVGQKLL